MPKRPIATIASAPGSHAQPTKAAKVAKPSAAAKASPAFAALKSVDVKKALKAHVTTVAGMVARNWHDGYEEQGEALNEYRSTMVATAHHVHAVIMHAPPTLAFLQRAHEALEAMADSWAQMRAIPMRGTVEESDVGDEKFEFETPDSDDDDHELVEWSVFGMQEAFDALWRLLLHRAALASAGVSDATLHRWIKTAVDFKVPVTGALRDDPDETSRAASAAFGVARFDALVAHTAAWTTLPVLRKAHKTKRVVDSRFSKPKSVQKRKSDLNVFADLMIQRLLSKDKSESAATARMLMAATTGKPGRGF